MMNRKQSQRILINHGRHRTQLERQTLVHRLDKMDWLKEEPAIVFYPTTVSIPCRMDQWTTQVFKSSIWIVQKYVYFLTTVVALVKKNKSFVIF